jgi:hypothetical protein
VYFNNIRVSKESPFGNDLNTIFKKWVRSKLLEGGPHCLKKILLKLPFRISRTDTCQKADSACMLINRIDQMQLPGP